MYHVKKYVELVGFLVYININMYAGTVYKTHY